MGWTLVTGGAKRLGGEICLTLAEAGHNVLVHYRKSKKEALEIVENCRSFGVDAKSVQADFTGKITDFISHLPELDHLVNNVGEFTLHSLLECSLEEYHAMFQTNLHAPFEIIRGTKIKHSIVNLGVSGIDNAHAPLYSLTKGTLLQMTKQLAREFAPRGVRVNMVSPGQLENSVDIVQHLPMERTGRLKEVARVVQFLIEPENSYITGQNIEVAGGLGL